MSLDDLDALPLADAAAQSEEDVDAFVALIDALLDTPACQFASDTLVGIRDTVRQHKYVTAGQQRAVANIEAGAQRGRDARSSGWKRRYEGW